MVPPAIFSVWMKKISQDTKARLSDTGNMALRGGEAAFSRNLPGRSLSPKWSTPNTGV